MKFSYKAVREGKIVNSSIEADDEQTVAEYLKSKREMVVSITPAAGHISPSIKSLFNKVNFSNLVDFTRQLSIMLKAGLSISDSLSILKDQAPNEAMLKLLTQVDEDVKEGNSFSSSLKRFPDTFSRLYIALVRAGEASGKLDEIMARLADTLERQRQFQSKTKSALIYPAFIVAAMIIVMFIMLTFVVPQLLGLYDSFDVELPATTRFLIMISNFMQLFWIPIILMVVGLLWFARRLLKTTAGKKRFDILLLRIPLINRVIKVSALVNSTRTLSVLVTAGVPILQSLDIIVETTSNILYQEAFQTIRSKVEKGSTLGRALDEVAIFPPIFVQMTGVGEKTGHLDETLGHLASYFESEAELAVKAVTIMIEPMILVFLGFGVGFVVISVVTPIFTLSQAF